MRKLFVIVLLSFLAISNQSLLAQSFKGYYEKPSNNYVNNANPFALEVGVQTNRSIRGWRTGWNIDVAFANKLRIGYFNTQGKGIDEAETKTDNGVAVSYLFNAQGRLSFGPDVRITVTDKRFISAIPMLQTRLKVTERLKLKSGFGLSDRYPIFDFGINFRIN